MENSTKFQLNNLSLVVRALERYFKDLGSSRGNACFSH